MFGRKVHRCVCIGIRARRTGASGVSGTISERGFRAKKHKESGGRASGTKQLTPWLPPTSFLHLRHNLLSAPFPTRLFLLLSPLVSFFSAALSFFSAVVPPEGFKNNSVNCIPVRRETEKSGWKKTGWVEVSRMGNRMWEGGEEVAVSIVVAPAWYHPGSFLPRK